MECLPPPSSPPPPPPFTVTPTWTNMPAKGQLAILCLSRFVDFFQMAAIQTFMVHQLRSFDPELSDVTLSHQAGVLQGAFTAAQIVTSILWGRAADRPTVGRKTVLMVGLAGTGLGCIGVAFSSTFSQAVFWRLVSGAVNGTVGAARTMVAECTPKPWHARAFLLLPAAFNVANVCGPILAGLLADPVENLSTLFGPNSTFGGSYGVRWMRTYPYALPNLLSAALLFLETALVHHALRETLPGKRPLNLSRLWNTSLLRSRISQAEASQTLLSDTDRNSIELSSLEDGPGTPVAQSPRSPAIRPAISRLPFTRIWTPNVCWTLTTISIFDFHMGAFANLWILFLATPRIYAPTGKGRGPFKFSSGLAFPPPTIGFAMAIIGFIGVALQFALYPHANAKYGLMKCFRASLFLFPVAYALAPYIALLPSASPPPDPASGGAVWAGIGLVLFLQVAARTFALPASIILLNNSSPHPSVLATVHGLGQACSASFRTLGPILAGWWYGVWTERGVVGMAWWFVAIISAIGSIVAFKVRNGTGHEILLPGEVRGTP
ncbi:MFS general substrate transporter [Piedraia hortae CBS 480.64]|uniref:MFS general substrate transporter n=1 Tax=Piedraia hortae CBS 480.64 TaxID=1314780 RepID=A0A6A7CAH4_9PEZI|nr:MFS general substrate transporter [Piedraia hortae CBS 480.64]